MFVLVLNILVSKTNTGGHTETHCTSLAYSSSIGSIITTPQKIIASSLD